MRAERGACRRPAQRACTPPGVGTPLHLVKAASRRGEARRVRRAPRSTPPAKSGRSHLKLGEGKTSLKSLLQFLFLHKS